MHPTLNFFQTITGLHKKKTSETCLIIYIWYTLKNGLTTIYVRPL